MLSKQHCLSAVVSVSQTQENQSAEVHRSAFFVMRFITSAQKFSQIKLTLFPKNLAAKSEIQILTGFACVCTEEEFHRAAPGVRQAVKLCRFFVQIRSIRSEGPGGCAAARLGLLYVKVLRKNIFVYFYRFLLATFCRLHC